MNPVRIGYVAAFGLAAVACLAAGRRARIVVDRDTRTGLISLLVLSAVWAAASAARVFPVPPAVQETLYLFGLVSGLATVGAWLYFCSAYTASGYHRRPSLRVAAVVVFLAVVSLKLTNPLHGRYYTASPEIEPFRHLAIELHALHWAVAGLAYSLSAVGFYLLYELFDQSNYNTGRLAGLVALTGLPAVFDIVAYTDAASDLLVKFNFEPIGVALFAVGALYVVDETFVAVPRFWRQELVDHLDEAIIVLDGADRVRDHNAAARALFPAVEDALGEPYREALSELPATVDRAEVLELDRGDDTGFFRLRSIPLAGEDDVERGRVLVFADVTEVERQRRELRRQTDQFDDFAEATTHELRNAVTLVDGYLDLVAEEIAVDGTPTGERAIDNATEGVDRMLSVVADLTTLVQYSRPLDELQPCDVRVAVTEGFSAADADGLDHEVEADRRVRADDRRLTELFTAVIEFAAANGASTVTVALDGDALVVATDGNSLSGRTREKALSYGEPVPSANAGMTLPNVQMLARGLGWTLTFDESYTDGTRLRFEGVTTV